MRINQGRTASEAIEEANYSLEVLGIDQRVDPEVASDDDIEDRVAEANKVGLYAFTSEQLIEMLTHARHMSAQHF